MKKKNISSLGGVAAMRKKGKKGRSAFGRLGAIARWKKYRTEKKQHEADLARRRERDRARREGR